jgi:hypothetical protein
VGLILLARVCALVIAVNMLVAAILFMPWIRRRETFSGLMGRWFATETGAKGRIAGALIPLIDTVVFWERNHCAKTYREERQARAVLYGETE